VISRSGSLGTLMCLNLTRSGLGQSAFIGIGGDPIIGTTTFDALRALDRDARTSAVVLVGEIGGAMEEEAAGYASKMKKPVVSFIAGRSSPPDKKWGTRERSSPAVVADMLQSGRRSKTLASELRIHRPRWRRFLRKRPSPDRIEASCGPLSSDELGRNWAALMAPAPTRKEVLRCEGHEE